MPAPCSALNEKNTEIRLLVLCAGNPEGERTFSGSAKSLAAALERLGCVHHKDNVLGWTDPFEPRSRPVRILRRLDGLGFEERYRWSRLCFGRSSARARAIAQRHPGFNACLMYGTTYRPQLEVPTYCYFDATVAQVRAAKAWEFSRFSERKAAWLQEYQGAVFGDCACTFPRSAWAGRSVAEDYGIPEDRILAAGAGTNYVAPAGPHGPYDTQTILFIGTEFERKGGPLLVDAFRRLRKRLPKARLVIVGCNPAVDEKGIEIVGPIPKAAPDGLARLLEQYRRASLFCIMSHFEPFGIVVVEAQDQYVPCVVPARFAFTETVADGITGRHVPEYNAETLAVILGDLLADPARLEAMGQAAHTHVRECWNWDVAARRIRDRVLAGLENSP